MGSLLKMDGRSRRDEGPVATSRLASTGALDVLRITRSIPSTNGDLLFLGVPARQGGIARSLQVSFSTDGTLPAPSLDRSNGRIVLHYKDKDHPEVRALLNSKRDRFCYFWRSTDGARTHAWLLSSK